MSLCQSGKYFLKHISSISIGVLILLIGSSPVVADQFDTVNYSAAVGWLYDSNVYRLPSWVDPQIAIGNPEKSDRIRQLTLGLNLDKKYSNQEIVLSTQITNNSYDTFTSLNYDATTFKAVWIWSLGSKLNGSWSIDRSQTLYGFEDIRTNTRNLRTLYSPRFNADWWFQANWHLLAGISNEDSSSSATTINSLSYRTKTTEWGVKYVPSDKTTISLLTRNINGGYIDVSADYIALLDTGYTESQDELKVNWKPTGKSVLSGYLLNVQRRYPVFTQRDYSVVHKGLSYAWEMSGETRLNISVNGSVNPWFDASSSYYDTNTVMLSSSWQISAMTDFQISLMRSKSDYRNPVVAGSIARYDINESQQIALGWSPQRSVKFSASYVMSQRASNFNQFEYADKTTNLFMQVSF